MHNLLSVLLPYTVTTTGLIIVASAFYSYVLLSSAVKLKKIFSWRTGISRKYVHLGIFLGAGIVQFTGGMPMIFWSAIGATIVIGIILVKRDAPLMRSFYDTVAREKDKPYERAFIIIPAILTAVGALFNNIFFLEFVLFGYLVAGLGDAAGEICGNLITSRKLPASWVPWRMSKTWAGSSGVFVSCCTALFIGGIVLSIPIPLMTILLFGFLLTFLEAISPPACDNITMQIAPVVMIAFFL